MFYRVIQTFSFEVCASHLNNETLRCERSQLMKTVIIHSERHNERLLLGVMRFIASIIHFFCIGIKESALN